MKVVFAGTPHNAAQTLSALCAAGIEVVAVLTRPDAAVGRKRILTPSPVALTAAQLALPIIKSNSVDQKTLEEISKYKPELGVVVAYGSLLDQQALDSNARGWINLHYSLLPKFRGAAPVQHAILAGETITGVTVFQLDSGMDTGDVYMQVPTQIEPDENSGRLLQRLTSLGISALLECIPAIFAGFSKGVSQTLEFSSLAPKLNRESARINWTLDAREIELKVRAMNPEPMAWTQFGSDTIRIISAREGSASSHESSPGKVFESGGQIFASCNNGSIIQLLELQPAGKLPMAAIDWFRGQQSKDQLAFE